MRATPSLEWTDIKTKGIEAFVQMIAKMWRNITRVINGHIGFGDGTHSDNVDGIWATTTTPVAPNTDFVITHNLGRLPVGYLVMSKDRAVDVYTGSVVATATQITLRASVASALVRLFIVCLLLTTTVFGQNARKDDIAVFNSSGTLKVLAGALITVCTSGGTGTPCTPLAAICSNETDVACVTTNPFNADVNGNYGFWAPPATYVVTITSNSAQPKTITYTLATGSGGGGGGGGNPGGSGTNIQYRAGTSTFGGLIGSSVNTGTGGLSTSGPIQAGTPGGIAGTFGCPQGTTPASVANFWFLGCQTAISGAGVTWLGPNRFGTSTGGKIFGSASGATVLLNQSGDSGHSIALTGQTTTLTNQVLCLAANCPSGEYEIEVRLNSILACGTPGPAVLVPTITYTDEGGTKTNQQVTLLVNGNLWDGQINLGTTTDQGHGTFHIKSTGVNSITMSFTLTACSVGTATYSVGVEATQIHD